MVREVLFAGEIAQEWPALQCDVITNRATQHGVTGLKCVEDRLQRRTALDLELYFTINLRQVPQMRG